MLPWFVTVIVGAICAVAFFFIGAGYRKKIAEREIGSAEQEATRIMNDALKSSENKKREMLLEAKEEIHKARTESEKEIKERRNELTKQERRLQQKEETLDKKMDAHERKEEEIAKRLTQIAAQQEEVDRIKKSELEVLERISGLTQEDAKK